MEEMSNMTAFILGICLGASVTLGGLFMVSEIIKIETKQVRMEPYDGTQDRLPAK